MLLVDEDLLGEIDKLELSSAKLRRLMKLCWEKFDEMIFDSLEAILKDSWSGFIEYLKKSCSSLEVVLE